MRDLEFANKLDAAILSGQSLQQLYRNFPINTTTIRRRKAALRAAGHTIPNARCDDARALRQERGVYDADKKY